MKANQFLTLAAISVVSICSAFGQTWTQQTNAPSTNWNSAAVSADGTKLVAVAGTSSKAGAIYTSSDRGVTWVHQTGAPSLGWQSVASSADGNTLVAVSYSPSIYTSTNSGATWIRLTGAPSVSFVAVSPNGERLFAAKQQYFYSSIDFGVSWITNVVSGAVNQICAASSDGSKIVSAGISGSVYTSTNLGVAWKAGPSSGGWTSVAASVDGGNLEAIGNDAPNFPNIFTSTDSGITWMSNRVSSLTSQYIASSADGVKLALAANGGGIYTSTNGGFNWASNNAPLTNWISVASSADGNMLVAAVHSGGIWISQTTPSPQLSIASTNEIQLSWLIPSTNFVLQQSSDLVSWSDVTNAPVLNLTNLQNQVMLPLSSSNSFFRLKTP